MARDRLFGNLEGVVIQTSNSRLFHLELVRPASEAFAEYDKFRHTPCSVKALSSAGHSSQPVSSKAHNNRHFRAHCVLIFLRLELSTWRCACQLPSFHSRSHEH